jgi:hypothetical protein
MRSGPTNPLPVPTSRIQPLSPCPSQISPHLIITWRPDLEIYAAHLQQPAPDNATVITGARASLLPALQPPVNTILGPALRLFQGDPWNNNPLFPALDKVNCLASKEISAAATWADVVGPDGNKQHLLEGVVPTNDITSVDCKQECAWVDTQLDAFVKVGDSGALFENCHCHVGARAPSAAAWCCRAACGLT